VRVLFLHLPRFPIQRRVSETPSLAGKPIVLSQQSKGHRQVAFASTSALTAGVCPGMTVAGATALVPSLREFPFQLEMERQALASLGEGLLGIAPGFQLAAPDGLWLDASAAPLSQGEEGLCRRALQICASFGYRGKAAVASQLFSARTLAREAAARVQVIGSSQSAQALSPLPLSSLESPAAVESFKSLGLSTLGEVASLPIGALVTRMGLEGLRMHRLCRGEDDSPFVAAPLTQLFEEQIELDWPAESVEPLLFALKTTFDRLSARLCSRRKAATRLSIGFRLGSGQEHRVELVMAKPSSRSSLLLELARHRIADQTFAAPVAGVAVKIEECCEDREHQQVLGETPEGDASLDVVLSRLASALGPESMFAAELDPVHRPERAYHSKPFRPPPSDRGLLHGTADTSSSEDERPGGFERPARFFERPAPLNIELSPQGHLLAARLSGHRRKVLAIAGPERLCGDWWEENPYHREYYRVHFEGMGQVWVFRDQRDGRFYLQGFFD
jgi:protein ImuB